MANTPTLAPRKQEKSLAAAMSIPESVFAREDFKDYNFEIVAVNRQADLIGGGENRFVEGAAREDSWGWLWQATIDLNPMSLFLTRTLD